MDSNDKWIPFKEVNWGLVEFNLFHIDTRDFSVKRNFIEKPFSDYDTIKKYPHFFFTQEQLDTLMQRLFTESGGEGEWRCLCLKNKSPIVTNWNLKYLRVYRTPLGFIVCNGEHRAINKILLSSPINQSILMHQ